MSTQETAKPGQPSPEQPPQSREPCPKRNRQPRSQKRCRMSPDESRLSLRSRTAPRPCRTTEDPAASLSFARGRRHRDLTLS
jgi:hypothetical protein